MSRPDTDWFLATMLDRVSATGEEQPLTVFCGGLAVMGKAVPEEAYFQKMGFNTLAEHAPQWRDESAKELGEIDERLNHDDISIEERQFLLSRADELGRRIIVMVDVTILGAGPTPIRAPVWRGRLSQVSGWIPGLPDERQ